MTEPVEQQRHIVTAEDDGIRLDRWFHRHFRDMPYTAIANLCRRARIRLDGSKTETATRLKQGQCISWTGTIITTLPKTQKKPEIPAGLRKTIQQAVIYRDNTIIALNKPCGLATQGGVNVTRHIDQLLPVLASVETDILRLVHRLDKHTSGVLLIAVHAAAAGALTQQFRQRDVTKTYWAVCQGVFQPAQGRITRAVDAQGQEKSACTVYATLARQDNMSLMALRPLSGRKHQLRHHCAFLNHPILGDSLVYRQSGSGEQRQKATKLHLHARSIRFRHPQTNRFMTLKAALPPHMQQWFQGAVESFDARSERLLAQA